MAQLDTSRIYGNLELDGTLLDSSGDAGTSGQVLSSTGTGTNWITASGGVPGIENYIKCVPSANTNLSTSTTASTLSWMSTTPSFSNGFSNPTATEITVPNDGLYLIGLNLDITQTDTTNGNRYNHGFEIEINGSATGGAEVRHNYIRGNANSSNHFNSSANAMKALALGANDTISIRERRFAGNTASTLQITTNSSIFVVQIA